MREHIDIEPSAAELAAIVAEEPLINAELAWLDAEIRVLDALDRGTVTDLDKRRLRRAERAVIRETAALVARLIRAPDVPRAA